MPAPAAQHFQVGGDVFEADLAYEERFLWRVLEMYLDIWMEYQAK